MRVCSFCGENNEDWMDICQRCGSSIVNANRKNDKLINDSNVFESMNIQKQRQNNSKIDQNINIQYVEKDNPPKEKKPIVNLDLKIILGVLLIILICLIVAVIMSL